jgi:hypothetical protein
VDIRSVKRWYQSGLHNIVNEGKRFLVPELLLYDDTLIRVDHEGQHNHVRLQFEDGRSEWRSVSDDDAPFEQTEPDVWSVRACPIRDAKTLQPVPIPRQHAKQFWVTVHVPEDAKFGSYKGEISVNVRGGGGEVIPLRLEVLPFQLEANPIESSIYYKWADQLDPKGVGTVLAWKRNPAQIRWELENLLAHGVDNPTVGAGVANLPAMLKLRAEAGMRTDRLYHITADISMPRQELEQILEIAKGFGILQVYFYMKDEAQGEALKAQRPLIEAVHDMGGKVFVAGYRGSNFPALGDIQDVLVCAGGPSKEEAADWHGAGQKIFCDANPQAGVEDPEIYRRNYGLLLALNDYDGAMTYIYCQGWNDFCRRWRAHNFIYPTADGGIDTIQWEGYREAMDDLRYLATLRKAIEEGKKMGGAKRRIAEEADHFVSSMRVDGDLDELRDVMTSWILRLGHEK